jgi:hypothetical protein
MDSDNLQSCRKLKGKLINNGHNLDLVSSISTIYFPHSHYFDSVFVSCVDNSLLLPISINPRIVESDNASK